jgi:hypothetical protein
VRKHNASANVAYVGQISPLVVSLRVFGDGLTFFTLKTGIRFIPLFGIL